MTFPTRSKYVLALACGLPGVWLTFNGHPLLGIPLIALEIVIYWRATPSALRQDDDVRALAAQLRQVAQDIPAGVHRRFRSIGGEHDVIVTPGQGRTQHHRFVVVSREVDEEAATLRPGSEAVVTANVYNVSPSPRQPLAVVHLVEATRLVWGPEDDAPREVPYGGEGLGAAYQQARLHQRTGVLTPDVDELKAVVSTVCSPEGFDDQAR